MGSVGNRLSLNFRAMKNYNNNIRKIKTYLIRSYLRSIVRAMKCDHTKCLGSIKDGWRAQRRVLFSNGSKTRHGKSRSHVA